MHNIIVKNYFDLWKYLNDYKKWANQEPWQNFFTKWKGSQQPTNVTIRCRYQTYKDLYNLLLQCYYYFIIVYYYRRLPVCRHPFHTHRKKGLDWTEKESKWWLRNSWSGIWLPLHTELVCPWGQLRQLPQVMDCQGASAFVHCSSSSCSLEFKCKGNRMKKEVGRGSSPPVSSHLLICSISIFHLKSGKAKQ